jgi:hypothetical protein
MRALRTLLVTASAASALVAAATGASAASRIGTLECDVAGSVGLIVGSNRGVTCRFIDQSGRPIETYAGNIAKLGLDIGVTQGARMVWAVVADTTRVGRGALAGTYTGASADASVVVGGGVKALIGGSRNTISLQPVSVQGQTGVNVAVGVESMSLTPVRARAR